MMTAKRALYVDLCNTGRRIPCATCDFRTEKRLGYVFRTELGEGGDGIDVCETCAVSIVGPEVIKQVEALTLRHYGDPEDAAMRVEEEVAKLNWQLAADPTIREKLITAIASPNGDEEVQRQRTETLYSAIGEACTQDGENSWDRLPF
jgi:hypothetical protein